MKPTRWRKRPIEVEALQYLPGEDCNCADIALFTGLDPEECCACSPSRGLDIHPCGGLTWTILTLEGPVKAQPGDWIIKGVVGEFYPCRQDVFHATYQQVVES